MYISGDTNIQSIAFLKFIDLGICCKLGHGLWVLVALSRKWKWKLPSHVPLFATPWTIQSMEFSRPEYWSGKRFPSPRDLCNPGIESRSPELQADSLPAEPQGKPKNTGLGSLSLLKWIFPNQESNWGLLHAGGFFTNWAIREALSPGWRTTISLRP